MDIYHYLMDEISGKLDRWRSSWMLCLYEKDWCL